MENFWRQVQKSEGCWLWTGKVLASGGYGRFCDGHKAHRAHRYSWELAYGSIPAGVVVCHRCDNPPCVRPDHLFLGSQLDNIRDMVAKGRHRGHFAAEFARRRSLATCRKGHPYSEENLYRRKDGSRICKTCHRARVEKCRAK